MLFGFLALKAVSDTTAIGMAAGAGFLGWWWASASSQPSFEEDNAKQRFIDAKSKEREWAQQQATQDAEKIALAQQDIQRERSFAADFAKNLETASAAILQTAAQVDSAIVGARGIQADVADVQQQAHAATEAMRQTIQEAIAPLYQLVAELREEEGAMKQLKQSVIALQSVLSAQNQTLTELQSSYSKVVEASKAQMAANQSQSERLGEYRERLGNVMQYVMRSKSAGFFPESPPRAGFNYAQGVAVMAVRA